MHFNFQINLPYLFSFFFCLVQVTEKRQTTEHEEFHDNELPEEDDNQSTGSRERIEQKVSGFLCCLFIFFFTNNNNTHDILKR